MIHGSFIGSGGVLKVSLPSLIREHFGCSENEARRLLRRGEVNVDGETTQLVDIPVEQIAGRRIEIHGEVHEVAAE